MCVCLSVYLSMFVWVWVCMYMSVCVCLSVSVCMCVWLTMLAETKEHSLQNIRFTLIAMLYCLLIYIQQIHNNTWLLEQLIPWFLNTHTRIIAKLHTLVDSLCIFQLCCILWTYNCEIEVAWCAYVSHMFCTGKVFRMVLRSNYASIKNSL